ncbi:hypothetical protein LSTR_LSTR011406 [Laodelphax striatellus]|uniref:Nuclear pore complex protein Nup98-Nup96 n=1 Tax=Laodelphax striatellus TaxID=195883 RepID=A0A482WNV5_LAOST|nr:hypothetical protein LSTR_LSTR011406 [Laodelphax striatellus]
MVKSGQTTTINTRHHCITCMKEYEAKSLEELRLEDYVANRKGPQQGVQSGGLFGAAPQPSLFGSNPIGSTPTTGGLFSNTATSGFGTSNSVFGSSGSSLFAKPATAQPTAFGSTPATNSTNTFGFNTGTTASNPFATNTAQKPFGAATPQTGTGLFGNNTSQQTNVFGSTTTGGFGSGFGTSTQNQMGGTAAGTTQGTPNFSFGQTANTSTGAVAGAGGSSLFGAKPATGGFGTFGQPAAGTQAAANRGFGGLDFGANTQTQTLGGGGGFGTFNKPATPFSFGQSNTTNTTLGGGLNLGGGSTLFGNTAAKPNLFGSSTSGGGLFGTGQSTFGTGGGTGTFGTATSGGMLGGGSLMGGLGSSSLMMPGTTMQNNQNVNNPLNQQIMALASVPFGDMSLFKNVLQITGKTDELLKPTSPAAQKAINSGQNFTISPRSGSKIKVKPIGASNLMKKSLFGGLEDHEDTNNNNNDSWLVKPSPKRLILRTKPNDDADVTSQGRPHSRLLNLSGTNSSNNTPGAGGGGNQDEEEVTFLTLSTPKFIQQRGAASTPANKDAETQSGASADKNKDQSLSSPTNKSNTSLENNDNTPGQQKGQSPSGNKSLTEDTSWAEKSVSNYTQTQNQSSENKENADHSSSSTSDSELEESLLPDVDQSQQTPHPTGIRLRRVGYYTIPSLSDLAQLMDADGRCVVDNFTIGRLNYGNVFYPDSFDVSGLNIDEIVHIRHKEIVVYPDDTCKPPLGTGLNRRAQVTLDRVWPSDKNSRLPISDPQRLAELDYEAKLRKASAKNKTRFVEYRPQTGSWRPPLRGLDMAGQTLMSETNGLASNKPVFLDEGDQDMCDLGEGPLKSLFDGNDELDLNHKSPTARFANGLGTTSHKVQMMKQSFYHDDEEDEFNEYNDEYMDMGDFRADSILDVDAYERDLLKKSKMAEMRNGISLLRSHFAGSPLYDGAASSPGLPMPPALASPALAKVKDLLPSAAVGKPGLVTSPALLSGPPPPVIVPQSLVLKLINRVVPWSQSVTYSQQAHCLSEFSVFMGRRFKVGWSPSCTLLSLSSEKQSMGGSALQADLGSVLSPRAEDDFSPFVLQRLRLKGGLSDDIATDFQESIEEHMEVALVHSIVGDEDGCPVFAPSSGNDELHAHCAAAHATAHASPETAAIWQLCDALWGDLPGAGEEAPLYASEEGEGSYWAMQERKRAVSGWLEACAQAAIKDELSRCSDNTPRTVFTLLTAHHVLDACNTAQDNREHFMALLFSEWETTTSGEPIYDVCYHLLRLYSFRSHPLERLLNPATHTSDPLDYRLSWLLMRVLDALGYSHLSQLATAQIHTAFALQLESHGCWHWAVFVLLHLSDGRRRRSAVEDMMGRHVTMARPDELTEEERFVLEKLRLPKKWLFTAKATLAKSLSRSVAFF